LNQAEIARLLGVTPAAVSQWKKLGLLPDPSGVGVWPEIDVLDWARSTGRLPAEAEAVMEAPAATEADVPVPAPPADAASPPVPAVGEPAPAPALGPAPPAPSRPVLSRPAHAHGDLTDFRARMARQQLACRHPSSARTSRPWGSFCDPGSGGRGLLGSLVSRHGGWDREGGHLPA